MSVSRLIRTIRPLKPVQIYGRLLYEARRPRARVMVASARRQPAADWTAPLERPVSLLGPGRVRLLNEEGPLAWNDSGRSALWLYNLHYFDDLSAAPTAVPTEWRQAMLAQWMAENPAGQGVGWDPYPTSLRIVNWIKWFLGGGAAPEGMAVSLATQARWLEDRIEWRLLGNHLLANAKGLVFAGAFFAGPDADRQLERGLFILRQQLAEQILADGGHFERSPMYHSIVLEDLMDLVNLARTFGLALQIESWIDMTGRMRRWLAAMTHPDGRIAFFNDAAFGVAAEPAAIEAYAGRLGLPPVDAAPRPVTHLEPSGYVRLQAGEATALVDVAPIGPDYLPGHAHADTLSFELSLGRERVIVNGGTSVYGSGPQRQRERSTAAHSTVEIEGRDSSEVWGGFRVGRRARVFDVEAASGDSCSIVSAAHDGYRWLRGAPVHRRTWRLEPGRLTVRDLIEGDAATATARFHLAPDMLARTDGDGRSGELALPNGRRMSWISSGQLRIEPSEWRPEFGRRVQSRQLIAPLSAGRLETVFTW